MCGIGFVYRALKARNHHRAFAGFTAAASPLARWAAGPDPGTHAENANQTRGHRLRPREHLADGRRLRRLLRRRLVPYGRLPWLTERWYGYWLLWGLPCS